MKNRFNQIFILYKSANVKLEDINLVDPDFDEDFQNWSDISPLHDDINKVRAKWEEFSEKSGEVDSSKFSKKFDGFSKWIDENIPDNMSFLDGVNSLINKIINFKQSTTKKRKDMTTKENTMPGVPDYMKTVAQPKSDQPPFDFNRWKEEIGGVESGGNYKATNKHTNALGKYQFVPKIWWSKIKEFAKGKVKMDSYEDFLGNPEIQESFMENYTKNSLLPKLKEFRAREQKELPEAGLLSDGRLMALFHFQGAGGAANWLKQGRMIGADINLSVPSYLTRIT